MPGIQLTFTVTDEDTAIALGSGSLPVLGTPRLLAWCEQATCAALDRSSEPVATGATSVGSRVALEHQRASRVGAEIAVTAEEVFRDGRLVRLSVVARDQSGAVVATGEITRVIVDAERFLARLGGS